MKMSDNALLAEYLTKKSLRQLAALYNIPKSTISLRLRRYPKYIEEASRRVNRWYNGRT